MGAEGVNGSKTRSNNTFEVWKTLGIEAARVVIMREITSCMQVRICLHSSVKSYNKSLY